jgi:hypothetical protein
MRANGTGETARAFEKEFADETVVPELNWHQAETEALESFIEDHARGFVARTDVL